MTGCLDRDRKAQGEDTSHLCLAFLGDALVWAFVCDGAGEVVTVMVVVVVVVVVVVEVTVLVSVVSGKNSKEWA